MNSFQFDGTNWRLHAGVILMYKVVAHVSLLGRKFAQVCCQPFRHQFPKLPTGNDEEFHWEEFNQFCQEVVLVHIVNILLSISGIKARVKPKNEKFRNHLARKQNLIKKMSRKKKMRVSLITMMTSTLLRKDGKQLKF